MANNIKITIITVTYNAEKILEETILSVLGQTYNNIEYIIIDGGSTDNTIDIIKKYSDQITYWVSEPDKGIYDAMNKGIRIATGEWINFMNAGDSFYSQRTIEECAHFINHNSDVDILYGNTIVTYKNEKYLSIPKEISLLKKHTVFCHQSSFIKTSLLLQYKFNIKYKILADYNLFRSLFFNKYQFKYIEQPISNYESENGVSATQIQKVELEYAQIKYANNKIKLFFTYIKIYIYQIIKYLIPNTIIESRKRKLRSKDLYLKKITK